MSIWLQLPTNHVQWSGHKNVCDIWCLCIPPLQSSRISLILRFCKLMSVDTSLRRLGMMRIFFHCKTGVLASFTPKCRDGNHIFCCTMAIETRGTEGGWLPKFVCARSIEPARKVDAKSTVFHAGSKAYFFISNAYISQRKKAMLRW